MEPDGLRADGISGSGASLMTASWGAAAVVFLPRSRAPRRNGSSACRTQSSTVYFAVLNHVEEKKKYPEKTGLEFFKQLKELATSSRIRSARSAAGAAAAPQDLNQMTDLDVVFCDEPTNHPDGSINVLRRNGAMVTLKPGDPDYPKALQTTKGK